MGSMTEMCIKSSVGEGFLPCKRPSAEWGAGLYRIMLLMLFTLFFNWELRPSDGFPALLYDDGGAARVLALFTAQEVMAR